MILTLVPRETAPLNCRVPHVTTEDEQIGAVPSARVTCWLFAAAERVGYDANETPPVAE